MIKEKPIGILTYEKFHNLPKNSIGSSRIRMSWLLPYWSSAEEYVEDKNYKTIIFQKVYWDEIENFKCIKIFDFVDPFIKITNLDNLKTVHAITVPTESLINYLKPIFPTKKIVCIPDRMNINEAKPIKEIHNEKFKKLIWFGYSENAYCLFDYLEEIKRRNIELTVISETIIDFKGYRVNQIQFEYEQLNSEIINHDAVFLPHAIDKFTKYKSNNKTIHSWSLKMPVIVNLEDFEKFESKNARQVEGEIRRKEVEEKWNIKESVKQYKELIRSLH